MQYSGIDLSLAWQVAVHMKTNIRGSAKIERTIIPFGTASDSVISLFTLGGIAHGGSWIIVVHVNVIYNSRPAALRPRGSLWELKTALELNQVF